MRREKILRLTCGGAGKPAVRITPLGWNIADEDNGSTVTLGRVGGFERKTKEISTAWSIGNRLPRQGEKIC